MRNIDKLTADEILKFITEVHDAEGDCFYCPLKECCDTDCIYCEQDCFGNLCDWLGWDVD